MVTKMVINASELHRAAGKVLKRVALKNEHLVVERDGYPVAVLMSYQEYEKLIRARPITLHRQLTRALGQEAERQGMSEEQLIREMEHTRREVFEDTYGKTQL